MGVVCLVEEAEPANQVLISGHVIPEGVGQSKRGDLSAPVNHLREKKKDKSGMKYLDITTGSSDPAIG